MPYIVGLTGGIGCGKSTIANLFAELGVPIVDADIVARQVVAKGSPLLASIVQHFGQAILLANGELNRAALRARIFEQPDEKAWLNHLLHPAIRQEMLNQLDKIDAPYVLWVVPLLLENHLETFCHRVLVIDVSEETQLRRAGRRDHNSVKLIQHIIDAQISRRERLAKADDIINNELPFADNKSQLQQQVAALHQHYLRLSQSQGNIMTNTDDVISVSCPICKKSVIWSQESPYRPFCSKRCQLIDLGEWAAEEKKIAGEESPFSSEIDELPEK